MSSSALRETHVVAANRESAMTTDVGTPLDNVKVDSTNSAAQGFALEEELYELLRNEEGRKREAERREEARSTTEIEWTLATSSEGGPTHLCTEGGDSSRHQIYRAPEVLWDGGYNSSTYTWATGAPGSIFSLPTPVVRRPPPAITRNVANSSYPRTGMSYSLPPHKQNVPSGRDYTQERFRKGPEETEGGPESMGVVTAPPPLDHPQIPLVVIGQHNALPGAAAQQKSRGCLGFVVKWWWCAVGRG